MQILEKVITTVGRALEFALTGQSDFRLTLSEFSESPTVNGSVQARLVLDELRPALRREFGIQLAWPVLLELKQPPGWSWKATFYHAEGNLGRYVPHELGERKAHQVMIIPGLPRPRFRAILGHELVHAYQREAGILKKNRALREGMARWIEYHLLSTSAPSEAQKLLKIRHYTFGKAVQVIVDYEKEHGTRATMEWLNRYDSQD